MSINIKNREAEHLLLVLKSMTGKGTSGLVRDLLRAEFERLSHERRESAQTRAAAEKERMRQALAASRNLQEAWRRTAGGQEGGLS